MAEIIRVEYLSFCEFGEVSAWPTKENRHQVRTFRLISQEAGIRGASGARNRTWDV